MDENGIPSAQEIVAGVDATARLIDRVNDFAGGKFLVHKSKRQIKAAQTKANGAIEALEQMGLDVADEEKRAIVFASLRDIKGFENIQATIDMVDIPDSANVEEVDDEWLSAFLDTAKNAFADWKRELLADSMKAKSVDPRSISLMALTAIAKLDEHSIGAFRSLCSICATMDEGRKQPLVLVMEDATLNLVELSVSDLGALEDAGLIRRSAERIQQQALPKVLADSIQDAPECVFYENIGYLSYSTQVHIGSKLVDFPVIQKQQSSLERALIGDKTNLVADYGVIEFTQTGKELAAMIGIEAHENIDEYLNRSVNRIYKIRQAEHTSVERDIARQIEKIAQAGLRRGFSL